MMAQRDGEWAFARPMFVRITNTHKPTDLCRTPDDSPAVTTNNIILYLSSIFRTAFLPRDAVHARYMLTDTDIAYTAHA